MEAETRDVVLTFKDGVQDSLFDLGFFYHIGSHLGEDELPWSRFKTIPVVFDNRHAVLKTQIAQIAQIVLRLIELSSKPYYLDVLIPNDLEDPRVYFLFT